MDVKSVVALVVTCTQSILVCRHSKAHTSHRLTTGQVATPRIGSKDQIVAPDQVQKGYYEVNKICTKSTEEY